MLIRNREGNGEGRRWKFTVGDAVGNDLDSEALSIADRFVPALAVTHYPRKLESLRDPAAVFLPIKIDRKIHFFMILPHAISSTFNRFAGEKRVKSYPGASPAR